MKKTLTIVATAILLAGCAGKVTYTPPENSSYANNEKIINQPFEQVWATAIPALSKDFFVINNLDKDSGLVNISYSGDPQRYLDCGILETEVSNIHGTRNYRFPGSSAHQNYEVMHEGNLFYLERKMGLDGRVNLIFEAIEKNKTKATANIRFVVTKDVRITNAAGGFPQTFSDVISFGANSGATFPGQGDTATRCISNGKLEQEILGAIN